MPARRIVQGQHVTERKYLRAKAFRHIMTPAERILWSALRANQLDGLHFRRQQVIDGFIVDFYCHTAGLIIEVDGAVHDSQPGYDAERERILSARELRILRLTNTDVIQSLPAVIERIKRAIEDSWPPDRERL
jgi:very-short-patch-repair endonuclease